MEGRRHSWAPEECLRFSSLLSSYKGAEVKGSPAGAQSHPAETGQLQAAPEAGLAVDPRPPSHCKVELKDSSEPSGIAALLTCSFLASPIFQSGFFVLHTVICQGVLRPMHLKPPSFVYTVSLLLPDCRLAVGAGEEEKALAPTAPRAHPSAFLLSPLTPSPRGTGRLGGSAGRLWSTLHPPNNLRKQTSFL